MARIRSVYSEAHDESINPSQKGRKRKARTQTPKPLPPFPEMGVGFLPPSLTDDQRINLRARQLLADRQARENPVDPGQVPQIGVHPLPDNDLYRDLDIQDPRGEQYNQFAGPTVFPEVNGPQMTHTKVRMLPEGHEQFNRFDGNSRVHASGDVIAAVSASDQTILAFDNAMTTLHTSMRSLRQKAERMAQSAARQDDNPGADNSPTSHAQNIVKLLATVLEPWFNILDDEFAQFLAGTEQGEAVEEANPGVVSSDDPLDEEEDE